MADASPASSADGLDRLFVVIVDDHPMVRDALSLAVERAVPSSEIIAVGGLDAMGTVLREMALAPDVILLDLDLGGGGDFSNLTTVLHDYPDVPVAIVSATESRKAMATARQLGAAGYLPKSGGLSDLTDAITNLVGGALVFPGDLDDAGADPTTQEAAQKLASLTPTQMKVFEGLKRGLLNKQIAYELNISLSTTKAHMTAIFKKLGVYNRTQALLIVQDLRLER